MFKFNKRKFSLLDSPGKLSSIHSSPKASPLKRLNLAEASPFQFCSKLMRDTTLVEPVQEAKKLELPKLIFKPSERALAVVVPEEDAEIPPLAESSTQVETPPPTPDVVKDSLTESLRKKRTALQANIKEIEDKIDSKLASVAATRHKVLAIKSHRIDLEHRKEVLNKAQTVIRDLLNDIYYPGLELSAKVGIFAKELRAKHKRKLEKAEVELNSYIDRADQAVSEKMENLKHEISLHERTLMTRDIERQQVAQKLIDEQKTEQKNSSSGEPCQEQTDYVNGVEKQEDVHMTQEKDDQDDCVIIDEGKSSENAEAISDVIDVCECKTDINVDDDDTDVDDNDNDESRSFTQCQAQRPE